ncbi:MAG TPA: TetR/AcrR family transcriptional regulator [Candidatus Binataceae bacterium]|nr:TetR/AcrR family transcriptional regulator [Candidatus Binataceae bacterium]
MTASTRSIHDIPNRFDRRREKTRLDLLEAAERVISTKGYHQTRIADIANEADVGLGTFYLHFKTKNEIFIELIETGAAELRAEVDAAKAGVESVEDKLRITIATILDAAAEHPEQFRIVFGHGPAFLDLMVRVHEMFIEDLRRDFEPTLGDRANAIANLTIGMLSQAVTWLLERTDLSPDQIKELTINFALGGLGRAASSNGEVVR